MATPSPCTRCPGALLPSPPGLVWLSGDLLLGCGGLSASLCRDYLDGAVSQLLSVWHPLPAWGVPRSDWWVLGTPLAGQARPAGHTRAAWLLPTLGPGVQACCFPPQWLQPPRGVCVRCSPRSVGPRCRAGPTPAAHLGVCGSPQWMLLGSLCALPPCPGTPGAMGLGQMVQQERHIDSLTTSASSAVRGRW